MGSGRTQRQRPAIWTTARATGGMGCGITRVGRRRLTSRTATARRCLHSSTVRSTRTLCPLPGHRGGEGRNSAGQASAPGACGPRCAVIIPRFNDLHLPQSGQATSAQLRSERLIRFGGRELARMTGRPLCRIGSCPPSWLLPSPPRTGTAAPDRADISARDRQRKRCLVASPDQHRPRDLVIVNPGTRGS